MRVTALRWEARAPGGRTTLPAMPHNWEEARDWLASGAGTGLTISCPRCRRSGAVTVAHDGEFSVEWHDDANGWTWRDAGVTRAELESPEFGCGHDRRVGNGFVGSAPFIAGVTGAKPKARAR